MVNLTVIILTYNEEKSIEHALVSVQGWAQDIFLLDSFSTDKTLELTKKYGCSVFQNHFVGYDKQRNYALERLPIRTQWIFFLDADEWIPGDLKDEISSILSSAPQENGYLIKRRFIWMGKWIRRGYYPTWVLRLFRRGKARCEGRSINEHMIVEGDVGHLKRDIVHEDRKGVTEWIEKHNRYATLEALELLNKSGMANHAGIGWANQMQRKRWVRQKVWNRLPPLIRPFLYFFYRYVLTGGFLDGCQAFIYHFLQALWFPMLIDIKYLEMKRKTNN